MKSEAASETPPKGKPGRPRKLTPGDEGAAKFIAPDVGPRHLQNVHYRQRALSYVLADDRLAWLATPSADGKDLTTWKPGILAELGRIEDGRELTECALLVCDLKPSVKEGVTLVRRWRLGRGATPSMLRLMVAIERAINTYAASHPGLTTAQVLSALDQIRDNVAEAHQDKSEADS